MLFCLLAGLSPARSSLLELTESIQARQPALLQQVKIMMTELDRISVLSIEQWHIALLDIQVSPVPATFEHNM